MQTAKKILITFDIEEFDLPLEYKQQISIDRQLQTGLQGLQEITGLLNTPYLSATLFTTGFFAQQYPAVIRDLSGKHEIASHSFSHTIFKEGDLERSKEKLEEVTGKKIHGIRMPRMQKMDTEKIVKAGYSYNSSINPAWLPGRYNNLHISRRPFQEKQLLQFPVSVTPHLRIPLFWLAFKNMPYPLYRRLVLQTLAYDGYVCLYFHPWEFTDLSGYHLPFYITTGSRKKLLLKIKRLIADLSTAGEFMTMNQYIGSHTSLQQGR